MKIIVLLFLIFLSGFSHGKGIPISRRRVHPPDIQVIPEENNLVHIPFFENYKNDRMSQKYTGEQLDILGNNIEYYIPINVGTPPKKFVVQLDTGSTLTVIPSAACTTCQFPSGPYDPTKSSTSSPLPCQDSSCSQNQCLSYDTHLCLFNITYGDLKNLQGALTKETMSIYLSDGSNLTATNAIFGAIYEENPPKNFESAEVDGILGMGFATKDMACLPNCFQTFFDYAVAENNVPDVFAMSLQTIERGYDVPGGELFFGEYGLPESDIVWTPIKAKSYYVLSMVDVQVEGVTVMPQTYAHGASVVDSGTTYLVIPYDLFSNWQNSIQSKYCHVAGVCGPKNIFSRNYCVDNLTALAELPSLDLLFESSEYPDKAIKIQLPPSKLMQPWVFGNSTGYCLGVAPGGFTSNIVILGDTFMRGFHTVFDRKNMRIGFNNDKTVSFVPLPVYWDFSLPFWVYVIPAGVLGLVLLIVGTMCIAWRLMNSKNQREEETQVLLS